MTKATLFETVSELPPEFDLELLMEKLIFVEKIEQGLKQFESGNTVPHEKVKDLIQSW